MPDDQFPIRDGDEPAPRIGPDRRPSATHRSSLHFGDAAVVDVWHINAALS